MKVNPHENTGIVRTSGREAPLAGLKPGDRIEAVILKRLGPGEALIETGGRVLSAKFAGPLPDTKSVFLQMNEYKDGTYHFSPAGQAGRRDEFSLLKDILLTPHADFHKLKNIPADKLTDLFIVNMLISGRPDRTRLQRHLELVKFLNSLRGAGFTKLELTSFAHILITERNEWILRFYQQFLKHREKDVFTERDCRETIKKVLEFADNKESTEKAEYLNEIAYLIAGEDDAELIPVFDGEEFSSMKIMRDGDSVLISADFTQLGHADIMFKKNDSLTDISFYLENVQVVKYFSEKIDILRERMAESGIICSFRFISRDEIVSGMNRFISGSHHGTMFSKRI